jgi:hypothetical protein
MTLMPVTRMAVSVDWSTKSGASAWIGAVSVWPIGPRSSIGSPITFMIRPRVIGPTGTRIWPPVSITAWPRVRPSVESIAIVRTGVLAEMLGDLEHEAIAVIVGLKRGEDLRQVAVEAHVDDRADHLRDAADIVGGALRAVDSGGCHGCVPCLLCFSSCRT